MNARWILLHCTYRALGILLAANLSCFAASAPVTPPPDVTKFVVDAPQPERPLEARQRHASGSGVFLLRVQIKTGRVTQVIVGLTTGDRSLDAAAVKALSQWRFKPGVLTHRKIASVRLSPPMTAEESLIKLPVTFLP